MGKDERRGDYLHWEAIPTRWADCDAYGHVNNVIYYSWFDTAVTRMLYSRDVLGPDRSAIGLCIESGCSFHAPVTFPDHVDAGVRIARLGLRSARYELGLFIPSRDMPAATGYFVHVFVDRATRRPVPIAPDHRAALTPLLSARGTNHGVIPH